MYIYTQNGPDRCLITIYTHWPLGDVAIILKLIIHDRSWCWGTENIPNKKSTLIGSSNQLAPSDNQPLPELMLTPTGIYIDNTPNLFIWNSKYHKIFRSVYIWLYSYMQRDPLLMEKDLWKPLPNRVFARNCRELLGKCKAHVNVDRIEENHTIPDNKVRGANMGSIWGRQDPGWSHVGPMNFAIWDTFFEDMVFLQTNEDCAFD